jgi:hypothetical protein
MKKTILLSALIFLTTLTFAQCPNYVLSENQNWMQQTKVVSQDTTRNTSQVSLTVYIEVENTPLGLFQTKCDTVYELNTVDYT